MWSLVQYITVHIILQEILVTIHTAEIEYSVSNRGGGRGREKGEGGRRGKEGEGGRREKGEEGGLIEKIFYSKNYYNKKTFFIFLENTFAIIVF